jgi:hypothetical protein
VVAAVATAVTASSVVADEPVVLLRIAVVNAGATVVEIAEAFEATIDTSAVVTTGVPLAVVVEPSLHVVTVLGVVVVVLVVRYEP